MDLIKRSDVLEALKLYGHVASYDYAVDAVNAIPEVSGEAVAYTTRQMLSDLYNRVDSTGMFANKNYDANYTIPLYTTPQDQSAKITELEAQLARFEPIGYFDVYEKQGKSKSYIQIKDEYANKESALLFALKD